MRKLLAVILSVLTCGLFAQVDYESEINNMECTSVTVGKKASKDGSVMTSHTDDSGRSRTSISSGTARATDSRCVTNLGSRTKRGR